MSVLEFWKSQHQSWNPRRQNAKCRLAAVLRFSAFRRGWRQNVADLRRAEREREREIEREREREGKRQTDRQTDSQTDKQPETDTEIEKESEAEVSVGLLPFFSAA